MARQTFTIEGLSDLKESLDELSKATGKNVLKRALMKAGQRIADDAQANAPRLTGGLAESIVVGTKLSTRQKSQHEKQSAVEVFVGPAGSSKSIVQEFGAAHQSPQPYMRPAWDANKKPALETIKDDIKQELAKAIARAERRAARLAAKMGAR